MSGYWRKFIWALGLTSVIVLLIHPLSAQPVDPKHAASWQFMQKAMPGVPYSLLKAACDEGSLMVYHGTWLDAQKDQIAAFRKRFPFHKTQKASSFQYSIQAS
jgi:hypothetical protein